ncbi:amidase [Syntrophotalea carbinolica DSM 2380]|uniref:Amidase n=1 Tax=Syntrophotalea carbinolica (strain DSM 2380 / NBRC 103641 / GraBd1) TaxID=338963 RepID=Q3A783_SYNC1|nr:amidase [Syntrophotalea carbinolica]ABA87761.1 amidase [Syntrophotalea carbinolica DSM 2380]
MASFPEYDQFDGTGLAELIKKGEISSLEVCEEAIRRAENLNPQLNAIITKTYALARETAKSSCGDAPFCGVPFLLKDAHHALKGVPMSCGSALLKTYIPQYDAEIVRRFKKAGLIILGKTNTPEFKLAYVTEPKAFGPTRNPWNPEYSCGGSSGGSAAAVAAGIVPFASATDEGGSIRVPASYCGLFGLKPSRGRNPVGPDFDEEWSGMSHSHVVTRSVRDSAVMLDAVCGFENGAPYGIFNKERPFIEEVDIAPGKLRIAFYLRAAYGKNIHPECVKAVEQACTLLTDLGHEVVEEEPDFREEDAALNYVIVVIGNAAALVDKLVRIHGRSKVRRELELSNYTFYGLGRALKALDFVKAKRRWTQFGVTMDQMLNKYDVVLTPTLGQPPVPVGSQQLGRADRFSMKLIASFIGSMMLTSRKLTDAILDKTVDTIMRGQMPVTFIANITGQPAMSVPLHWSKDGLPCGVQFIGRYGDEAKLLRLAGQLEKAQPWFDKRPQIQQ